MNKNKIFLYALLIILLPIAIVTLSGNGTLRVSSTYGYHFNDIQASGLVDSSLSNTELAEVIAGYFNSFSDEEFQIYEQNGEFLDPVFDKQETDVMQKSKTLLKWTLIGGGVVFLVAIILYVYLLFTGEKRLLRNSGIIAVAVTVGCSIAKMILVGNTAIRAKLYAKYIGIVLNDESSLKMILGSPMERIYLVFSSLVTVAILIAFLYIHLGLTKERGMFKRK